MNFRHYLGMVMMCSIFISNAAAQSLTFAGIEHSENSIISFQVLEEAYHKLGITIVYKPLPGVRALVESSSGKVDGEVFRIANVEKKYPDLIPVSTPINQLEAVAFSKKASVEINDWQSIKDYQLGIQVGILFAERGTKGMNVTSVDTNEQLMLMLSSERIELAIAARTNGLVALQNINAKNIHIIEPPIRRYPLYHYLHKKHKDLVPKLDIVLQQMQESGRIEAIRKLYLQELVTK